MAACAFFLAVSCGPAAPRGAHRLAADAENHDFSLDLAHGRVLFVHGTYPRKSYLCAQPLSSGRASCARLAGYALGGGVWALRDGATALVAAAPVVGGMNAPGSRPAGRALLRVDLKSGEVLRAFALAHGARVFTVAEPSWAAGPVAAVEDGGGLSLARLGDDADLSRGSLTLASEPAGAVAIAADRPLVAATAWGSEGGLLRVFDALSGQVQRELKLRSPGLLQARPDGWLLTVQDENGRDTVAILDDSGRVAPLLSTEDAIETMAAGARWLYAVSLSSHGRFDARRKWLRPRELRRVDLSGAEAEVSAPWTQRQGELLALDETSSRLYFAVTDRDAAAVWLLPADPSALSAAAPAIDSPSPLLRAAEIAIPAFFVIGLSLAVMLGGRLFAWRRR